MKLYTKPIKVCNLDYEVVNTDSIIHDGVEVHGLIEPKITRISINKNLSVSCYKQTLMHEVVHAVMLAYNIDSEMDLERHVDCMASGVLTVMRDNPSLVEFFMDNEFQIKPKSKAIHIKHFKPLAKPVVKKKPEPILKPKAKPVARRD